MDEVTQADFRDYQRLLSARPSTPKRLEYMLAQVCYVLAACQPGADKKHFTLDDFLLFESKKRNREPMTVEQMVSIAKMMAAQSPYLQNAR